MATMKLPFVNGHSELTIAVGAIVERINEQIAPMRIIEVRESFYSPERDALILELRHGSARHEIKLDAWSLRQLRGGPKALAYAVANHVHDAIENIDREKNRVLIEQAVQKKFDKLLAGELATLVDKRFRELESELHHYRDANARMAAARLTALERPWWSRLWKFLQRKVW